MNEFANAHAAGPAEQARFSVAEFLQIAAVARSNGIRLELSEGALVRMSPALGKHMRLQREIYDALSAAFAGREGGPIVQFELTLQLGDATLRDVDIGVIRRAPADDRFGDPADVMLAVEVAKSTLGEDLGGKLRDYAHAGIPAYWVVDAERLQVHVMSTPLDGGYAERRLVSFGQALSVPGTDRSIVIS